MATSLHAASGRYSAGAVCAAVCVQRRRTVAKAHTGHRKRTSDSPDVQRGKRYRFYKEKLPTRFPLCNPLGRSCNSNLSSCFPFVVIANQCAHYDSLRAARWAVARLYGACGRTWCGNLKNPLRHSRFPRQCAHWLGMTIGLCVVLNSSINWNCTIFQGDYKGGSV